jgi:SAM-dependent methyltransferase
MTLASCPVCGGTDTEEVFTLRAVPVVLNQLWPDAAAARDAPVGDVELVMCAGCALIWNRAFDPGRMVYAPGYENALHFSPRFQAFAEELAAGLVARHALKGRHIVEIGCGDGYMLDLMVKHGAATATGFDPSMKGRESPCTSREGVRIVPEYFRADQLGRPLDFVICRHTLEHLDTPAGLLRDIRRAIGGREVPVYFEVPNAGWMLEAVSMWDVIYEHVTYWTAPSLAALFRRTGFLPDVREGYGGQFLMVEARPGPVEADHRPADADVVGAAARAFADAAKAELAKWRERLSDLDGRAVIWGAGSKGIGFANALGPAGTALAALVDLNPRKHGLMAPGIALPVVAPDDLRAIRPDLVLISNALYEEEIVAEVRELGLQTQCHSIAG